MVGLNISSPSGASGECFWLNAWNYSAIVAGTWAYYDDSGYNMVGGIQNTSVSDADEINWQAYISAGTYTIYHIGIAATDRPKVDVYIGSTKVISGQDWYNNPAIVLRVAATGISIPSGPATVRLVINGKNAGSAGYSLFTSGLLFVRTG